MTAIATHLDRRFAQTVAATGRAKVLYPKAMGLAPAIRATDWIARAAFHVWRNHRYLTTLKLLNMAAVNVQAKLKTERVLGLPYKMKIETTNICNTHCQLCPTGIGLEGRPKGKMDLATFRKLIDRHRRHLVALDLSMWGDPLIVPDIYEMIRYAHDRGVWTYISSNLHAYKLKVKDGEKSQAEKLVESGLDVMTCSLHGASQETYGQYQPGKSFDEAVAKVRHIVETRDRMGSRTPQVQLNFVVMKQNEHEIPAFRKLAAELGCKAVFSTAALNTRFVKDRRVNKPQGKPKPALLQIGLAPDVETKQTRKLIEQWLPQDKAYRLPVYDEMLEGGFKGDAWNGKKKFPCDWLWKQAVINWDGQVSTCCGSWDPIEDMGNVLEHGLGKIWNGEKYRLGRRSFKKPLTDEQAKGNGCATCPGFMV